MEIYIMFCFLSDPFSIVLFWVLFKVIEHFSFLLVFYVVVWGMRVVKLHASVIKTLITLLCKSEMCHCETFIIFNIHGVMEFLRSLIVFLESASFNALLALLKMLIENSNL